VSSDRAANHGATGAAPKRRRKLRVALFALIGVLYVVSVPWYRGSDAPLRVVLGLPDWVAVALLCYVGVAILNSIAWLLTDIPDTLDSDDPRGRVPDASPGAESDSRGRPR
jgi:hypothetical protein